jgi:hypothetical protein
LRQVENISGIEEEMVYVCEPKVGENMSEEEERSIEDIANY